MPVRFWLCIQQPLDVQFLLALLHFTLTLTFPYQFLVTQAKYPDRSPFLAFRKDSMDAYQDLGLSRPPARPSGKSS
jgi:hypothetical protein